MDTHLDIVQLEEAYNNGEAAYSKLVGHLEIGVGLYDPNSTPIQCNRSAHELLGMTRDQFLGKSPMDPYWSIVHEDGSRFESSDFPIIRVITTYEPILGTIMGVSRPLQNDRVWLEVNTHPRLNHDGSIRLVICTYKDVTARYAKDDD